MTQPANLTELYEPIVRGFIAAYGEHPDGLEAMLAVASFCCHLANSGIEAGVDGNESLRRAFAFLMALEVPLRHVVPVERMERRKLMIAAFTPGCEPPP